MRKPSCLPYYTRSALQLLRYVKPPTAAVRLAAGREPVKVDIAGARFEAHSLIELWTLKETFLDRFYDLYGLAVQPGWRVVDVGAASGEFTIHALRLGASHVVAVDPDRISLQALKNNLKANGIEPGTLTELHAALVSEHRPMREPGSGSRHKQATPGGTGNDVRTVLMPQVLEPLGGHCDLLKMDCEGAEFEVIQTTPDHVWEHVDRITMEYHESSTSSVWHLVERLHQLGFSSRFDESPVHRGLGYLYAISDRIGERGSTADPGDTH